jgi:cell division protein FtsB
VSEENDIQNPEEEENTPKKNSFGFLKGFTFETPSRAVALAVLLVVLVLFGRDVLSSWHLRSEIGELQRRKSELQNNLAADSTLLRNLDDPEFLERYARENYLMRRAGDEVYIIDEN